MHALRPALAALLLASLTYADCNPLTVQYSKDVYQPGEVVMLTISGDPGTIGFLGLDTDPGPTTMPAGTFDLGFSSNFMILPLPPIPAEGSFTFEWWCENICINPVTGTPFYTQAISFDPITLELCISNSDALVVDGDSDLCPCGPCKGGVTSLTMQYQGASAATVEVAKGGDLFFSGNLDPNGTFQFTGTGTDGKLPKDIEFFIDGQLDVKVHTSCSKPIGSGVTFGSFYTISATSKDNGIVCAPGPDDCSAGKPALLIMQYTGDSCADEFLQHSQDDSKVVCIGDSAMGDPVHIISHDKDGGIWFQGDVALDGTFPIDASVQGKSKLPAQTFVDIYDAASGVLLQEIEFHTSCSQPLAVGNQFGGVKLLEFVPES